MFSIINDTEKSGQHYWTELNKYRTAPCFLQINQNLTHTLLFVDFCVFTCMDLSCIHLDVQKIMFID